MASKKWVVKEVDGAVMGHFRGRDASHAIDNAVSNYSVKMPTWTHNGNGYEVWPVRHRENAQIVGGN